MMEGELVLARLPQAAGAAKVRPAVVLRQLPPFGDLLLCGVSSQLQQEVVGFDELITPMDADFAASGLRVNSLLRLGYLVVLPQNQIAGTLGKVAPERHRRLLRRLSDYLRP